MSPGLCELRSILFLYGGLVGLVVESIPVEGVGYGLGGSFAKICEKSGK